MLNIIEILLPLHEKSLMCKNDCRVIAEKNCQLEIIKDIHEGKAIITLKIIHAEAIIICFNSTLLEWKQNPDSIKVSEYP